jgi:hypothetical protein
MKCPIVKHCGKTIAGEYKSCPCNLYLSQLCKRPGLKWHSAGISPTPMGFINTPVEKDRIPK